MTLSKRYVPIAFAAVVAVALAIFVGYGLEAQEPQVTELDPLTTSIVDPFPLCSWQTEDITVNGSGTVALPADVGVVSMGVEVTAVTVSSARSQAATAMSAMLESVKSNGIKDDEIATTQFNIYPETTWVEEPIDLGEGRIVRGGRSVVIGYRVTNRVSVNVSDLDTLADIVDDATVAGGNFARVDSISFVASDTSTALDEARKLAVKDASHRAQLYADEFGVDLGVLVSMEESNAVVPILRTAQLARVEAFDAPTTPLSSGDVTVEANITAKFAIADPDCQNWLIPELEPILDDTEANSSADLGEGIIILGESDK